MAWTTIIAKVRRILNEKTAANSFWTDDIVTELTKEAEQNTIEKLKNFFKEGTAINIVAGTSYYTIPTDLLRISSFSYDGTILTPATNPELIAIYGDSYLTESGAPLYYQIIGNTIRLTPIPDVSKTGGLTSQYLYLPDQGTNPTVSSLWQRAVVYKAAALCFEEDNANLALAGYYEGLFKKRIREIKALLRGSDRKATWQDSTRDELNDYWDSQ